jgi:hypothetical protein
MPEAMPHFNTAGRRSLGERITSLRGAAWKALLRFAEQLAYDVAGLPMALRHLGPLSEDLPPAEYLHRFHARSYWKLPFGPLKGLIAAILWPLALVVAVIVFTRRNGTAIAARSGVSVAAQVAAQVSMAARYSIAPFWFYMFELHLAERRKNARLYLTAHETIGPAYSLLQPPKDADGMDDKIWFAEHCHQQGVRAVPVFMHFSGGESKPLKGGVAELPDCDLFVKPRSGSGGHRMERWDFRAAGATAMPSARNSRARADGQAGAPVAEG